MRKHSRGIGISHPVYDTLSRKLHTYSPLFLPLYLLNSLWTLFVALQDHPEQVHQVKLKNGSVRGTGAAQHLLLHAPTPCESTTNTHWRSGSVVVAIGDPYVRKVSESCSARSCVRASMASMPSMFGARSLLSRCLGGLGGYERQLTGCKSCPPKNYCTSFLPLLSHSFLSPPPCLDAAPLHALPPFSPLRLPLSAI